MTDEEKQNLIKTAKLYRMKADKTRKPVAKANMNREALRIENLVNGVD